MEVVSQPIAPIMISTPTPIPGPPMKQGATPGMGGEMTEHHQCSLQLCPIWVLKNQEAAQNEGAKKKEAQCVGQVA